MQNGATVNGKAMHPFLMPRSSTPQPALGDLIPAVQAPLGRMLPPIHVTQVGSAGAACTYMAFACQLNTGHVYCCTSYTQQLHLLFPAPADWRAGLPMMYSQHKCLLVHNVQC